MKKRYTAKQKAQIVLEIFKEELSIAQIASEYGIHPNQLYRWKAQALENLASLFEDERKGEKALQAEHFKVILHVNQAPRNLIGWTVGPPFTNAPGTVSVDNPQGPYLTRAQRRDLGAPVATGTPADFESPLDIRNYWAWHRAVFALGIDGWWPDDGDELPIEARISRHVCYYEGPLLERPNERPWSLHRNGYAGVARYGGWLWSGDTQSRWATLAAHVPVVYVNTVGGQDELIFDGGSFAVDAAGVVTALGPSFEETLLAVDVRRGLHGLVDFRNVVIVATP